MVLRYFEDMDEPAICQLLDISPGTVRSQLHKARRSLRLRFSELESDLNGGRA